MNFVLSESELYLKVVPMDWIIFFVILGHLKMFDIRHAVYLIRSNGNTFVHIHFESTQHVRVSVIIPGINPEWALSNNIETQHHTTGCLSWVT